MTYPIDDIIREVRIVLDLNPTSEELLPHKAKSSLSLDELIRSRLLTALEWLYLNAPTHLLGRGENFAHSRIAWDSGTVGVGSGRIVLPSDFLRLISFRMSDWHRPVRDITKEGDEAYPQQFSPFPGIKGKPERPTLTLHNETIGKVLHLHACRGGRAVYIQQALYLPHPQLGQELELGDELYQALIYYTAHLVATSLGNYDFATRALELSKTFIQ